MSSLHTDCDSRLDINPPQLPFLPPIPRPTPQGAASRRWSAVDRVAGRAEERQGRPVDGRDPRQDAASDAEPRCRVPREGDAGGGGEEDGRDVGELLTRESGGPQSRLVRTACCRDLKVCVYECVYDMEDFEVGALVVDFCRMVIPLPDFL